MVLNLVTKLAFLYALFWGVDCWKSCQEIRDNVVKSTGCTILTEVWKNQTCRIKREKICLRWHVKSDCSGAFDTVSVSDETPSNMENIQNNNYSAVSRCPYDIQPKPQKNTTESSSESNTESSPEGATESSSESNTESSSASAPELESSSNSVPDLESSSKSAPDLESSFSKNVTDLKSSSAESTTKSFFPESTDKENSRLGLNILIGIISGVIVFILVLVASLAVYWRYKSRLISLCGVKINVALDDGYELIGPI